MTFRPLLLALSGAVLLASTAFAKIERTVEKSFPVTPGGLLKLNTYSGSIEIRPSSEPQSAVKVTLLQKIDASDDTEANALLDKLTLTFDASASDVVITAKYPKREGSKKFFSFGSSHPISLVWKISVPSAYNIDVNTSGGSISIGDLRGNVKADTSGGSIRIGNIDGNIRADTSGGSIHLDSATGSSNLDTSGGSIKAGTLKGPARLDTSAGAISVAQAENTIKADTSAGSIDITFVGAIKGPCDLDTSAGSITVRVDKEAAFDLVADTSAGHVTCELPITIEGRASRDRLVGKVNGGGPRLKLDTSAGSIRVNKR